ncbi:acyl-CoA dehydrogenase family protein [Comamonadaceae bacterium G21597-S1]|nr:acyl-CoA dehydrogenase family protein [Comamonadaceae bacterium G21597-S1]
MSTPVLPVPKYLQDPELTLFSDQVARFFERNAPATRSAGWRAAGQIEREFWNEAGAAGLLGVSIPEQYGGMGGDFRHDIVVFEQVVRHDVSGFAAGLHNGIVTPYVHTHGTEAQKRRWLPRLCSGELVAAIAMSEPGAGSDLQALRTRAEPVEGGYRISGAKTFISNGQVADFIVVAAKTDPNAAGQGVSLLAVETGDAKGFQRGNKLKKIGMDASDTSELFFEDVWVPRENLLGEVQGKGFSQLITELPRERLIIALMAMVSIEMALQTTLAYVKQRHVFGKAVLAFQNTQFKLADLVAEATATKIFVAHCVEELLAGRLQAEHAAMAKLLATELQGRVVDQCLQFHGGYGYVEDYPIARMYRDARISRIYGGSSEIMRLVIARSL